MSRAEVQEVVRSASREFRFPFSQLEQDSVKIPSPASLADSADSNRKDDSIFERLGFENGINLKASPDHNCFWRSSPDLVQHEIGPLIRLGAHLLVIQRPAFGFPVYSCSWVVADPKLHQKYFPKLSFEIMDLWNPR